MATKQKKTTTMTSTKTLTRARTPDAVAGRRHAEIQTDNYLEELTDKPHEEDAATQTEAAMDRPAPALFIPVPSGDSKETQIFENDLWDFDFEVDPILEVLVGKALDQSLVEVLEEQELKAIKAQQELFEQRRAVELAEAQRLEAAEHRRLGEKQRRLQQEQERIKKEQDVASKMVARTMAKDQMVSLQETVLTRLHKAGMFPDPIMHEVDTVFMPWLFESVHVVSFTIRPK